MNSKHASEQELHQQLDDWKAQISLLKEKSDHAPDYDMRAEYIGQVEEIHALQQSAIKKLKELERDEDTSWEFLKEEIETSWEKLESAARKLASIFK